jgi:hypothetical protein
VDPEVVVHALLAGDADQRDADFLAVRSSSAAWRQEVDR